jgi:hypothetical protein
MWRLRQNLTFANGASDVRFAFGQLPLRWWGVCLAVFVFLCRKALSVNYGVNYFLPSGQEEFFSV